MKFNSFIENLDRNPAILRSSKRVCQIFSGPVDPDEDPHFIRHYIVGLICNIGLGLVVEDIIRGLMGGSLYLTNNGRSLKKRGWLTNATGVVAYMGIDAALTKVIAPPVNDMVDFLVEVVNTGRLTRLREKGWTDEAIAEKLKMDVDDVRMILSNPEIDDEDTETI